MNKCPAGNAGKEEIKGNWEREGKVGLKNEGRNARPSLSQFQ